MSTAPTTPTTKGAMLDIVLQAMQAQYADLLPTGFGIYLIAEYDPQTHSAPNLWLEARENPEARYLAILTSDTECVPALGETVSDAINTSIAKIEARHARAK